MYIIYPIEKDTYITNKFLKVDGKNANFGKSSTLDLYKTYNENTELKSSCLLNLNKIPVSNIEISFQNTLSNEINILIDITIASDDISNGQVNIDGKYVIGISDLINIEDILNHIKTTLNDLSLGCTVYTHKNGSLLIEQDVKGVIGDKILTLIDNDENFTILRNFSRVEESVILLKSDLTSDNEYFSYSVVQNYIKIYLELHDITTSLSKPKDYGIEVLPLTKDFNEGLGRDVYSLTDIDTANWIYCNYNGNTNEKIEWETAGEIGLIEGNNINTCDLLTYYDTYNFKTEHSCQFYFENGNEDAYIDVTPIYEKYWQENSTLINKGFAIKFVDQNLFDNETYFAKRFGSKNVRNGSIKPCLKILIDDESYNIPINNNFYFNEENKIFLYNKKGGKLRNIQKIDNGQIVDIDPSTDLTLNITSLKTINNNPIYTESLINCFQMTDIKGADLKGIYAATWQINSLDQINILNELLINDFVEFKFDWYNGDNLIHSINKKVYKDNLTTENKFKRLRAAVKLYSPDLGVLNEIHKISVTFFDLDAQYDFVKVKKSLEGLDVGDIFYEVIDYDTNEILIPATEEMNATRCLKENDYYWFPFFNSDIFYGRRIQFIFKLKQQEQNNLIVNTNEVFRVGNNG